MKRFPTRSGITSNFRKRAKRWMQWQAFSAPSWANKQPHLRYERVNLLAGLGPPRPPVRRRKTPHMGPILGSNRHLQAQDEGEFCATLRPSWTGRSSFITKFSAKWVAEAWAWSTKLRTP